MTIEESRWRCCWYFFIASAADPIALVVSLQRGEQRLDAGTGVVVDLDRERRAPSTLVDDAHRAGQIGHVVLKVVGAAVSKGKQGGGLAHPARPEARARAPLGSEVERCAKDAGIGLDGVPVLDNLFGAVRCTGRVPS